MSSRRQDPLSLNSLMADGLCWGQIRGIEHQGVTDTGFGLLDIWAVASQDQAGAPEFQKLQGWKPVQLTTASLEALTPLLSKSSRGSTTLTSTLGAIFADLNPTYYDELRESFTQDAYVILSSVVSTLVADGMSRTAYASNYADQINRYAVCNALLAEAYPDICRWHWSIDDWDKINSKILRNEITLNFSSPYYSGVGSSQQWHATVDGSGLKANERGVLSCFRSALYLC